VPIFETFDCPSPALPTGRRQVTTTATQALVLLNSGFANEKAAAFAERVLEAGPSADGRIARAFELALSRAPTSDELELARDYLADLTVALGRSEPSLAFRPRVPRRIDTYYLERVGGADLLYGPEAGWTFLAGEWGEPYNHTVQALPHREPAALLDAPRFDDGGVRARVRLSPGCERACLLLRADSTGASTGARGELATGIEVALDARAGLASVALLPDDGGEARTLAERAIELEPERWYELVIDLHGARLALALDGEPVLEVADLPHTAPGRFGARAVGDGFELADASLLLDGDAALPLHAAQLAPERLALESLCLTLFNANEFLWID
jgi:hypothetical protein